MHTVHLRLSVFNDVPISLTAVHSTTTRKKRWG